MKSNVINDRNEVYKVYSSSCTKCKFFNYDNFECKAFEGFIPDEILSGKNKHLKPLPDQGNDIVFEPIDKKTEK